MTEAVNNTGRLLCQKPLCNGRLWLRIKASKSRTCLIPAFNFDPYISQGLKNLVAGKCLECGSILTADQIVKLGKR